MLPRYCWFDLKFGAGSAASGTKTDENGPGRWISLAKVVAGLTLRIGSSHFLAWGVVGLAKFMKVSELVIGLTIVAAGTSLPERASAIASARRGHQRSRRPS